MNNLYEWLLCPIHGLPALLMNGGAHGLSMLVGKGKEWACRLREWRVK